MAAAMKGAISFGLLHVPISLHTATQDNDIHFNQLCREDGSRIKYKKVCSKCGKEVEAKDIVKGFEIEPGRYVTLSDEDFEKAKVKKDKTIQILHFADLKDIRPIFFDKTYHAVPESGGDKPYELLRRCMLEEHTVAIAKGVIGQSEHLLVLIPTETGLLAETLFYNDEVKSMPKEPAKPDISEQGLEGIVAKEKTSLYFQGKRTKTWLKMKNLMDDDFVVCGWIPKDNNMSSIVLGQYKDGKLIYKGHVTLGVGGEAFAKIKVQPRISCPPIDEEIPEGHGNEAARWIAPTLVCVVSFMHHTKNGGMRQPVFKGLREDKTPEECIDNT